MNFIEFILKFTFIRESGQNAGNRVEAIQKWCGGLKGESWCCYFATMILDIWFIGKSPIPRLGACQAVYNLAKKNNWLVSADKSVDGDIIIYVDDNDHAHHIGFKVTVNNIVNILAGNTSSDGTSSNGDGCYIHELTANPIHVKYIHYPR